MIFAYFLNENNVKTFELKFLFYSFKLIFCVDTTSCAYVHCAEGKTTYMYIVYSEVSPLVC